MRGMTAVVLASGAGVVLGAGYAVGGQAGLFVLGGTLAAAALLAARLRLAGPPAQPPAAGPPRPAPNAQFPGYRALLGAFTEASASMRHFDLVARPVLLRLLAALLAGRRRIDLAKNPAAGGEVFGPDLWPLLDPARPPSTDSRAPGVSLDALAAIVERLEGL